MNNRKAICEKHPWVSKSLGVHKSQVKETAEALKRAGARCEVDGEGRIVARSNAARNDAIKFFGLVDRDGGYGDHTG